MDTSELVLNLDTMFVPGQLREAVAVINAIGEPEIWGTDPPAIHPV